MLKPALRLYAGPRARRHIEREGLRPQDIRIIPAAAGGPKGLILGPLDRYLFGNWLRDTPQTLHLVGASIGAWRMAAATLPEPVAASLRLEDEYIHQTYDTDPGRAMPTAAQVSRGFSAKLQAFFGSEVDGLLRHPRRRLHLVTSRGRHILAREGRVRTPLGYLGAVLSNSLSRRTLGQWLERVIFSSPGEALPIRLDDLRHHHLRLTTENFHPALLASCSIPFVLRAVHDIPGAPSGAYWDGGITDYHLHLDYASMQDGLVLYPHFQKAVVPGWLDKHWRHRHGPTPALDNVLVLAPSPEWVAGLPNRKLPDRTDFKRYAHDVPARVRAWQRAVAESERLAAEFSRTVENGNFAVQAL